MKHFLAAFVLFGALLTSASAGATPSDPDDSVDSTATTIVTTPLRLPNGIRSMALTARRDDEPSSVVTFPPTSRQRDPLRALLLSLDLTTGVVQGYDGFLTLRVLKAGGVETNPLMKGVAGNQGAMLGIKVAAALATVVGAESLWKRDHRVGAVLASFAANSAMAMVAHHNAKVLARLEGR
jgi:hypothetical protein